MFAMSGTTETVLNAPILESGVLPRRKPGKHLLGFIVGLLTSLLFAAVVGAISTNRTHTSATLLLSLPILMLTVALHELGHVAAGVMVGFHFSSISIGPLSIGLQYGKVKFKIRAQSGPLGYAGMHIETVSRLRRNLFIFGCGGPLDQSGLSHCCGGIYLHCTTNAPINLADRVVSGILHAVVSRFRIERYTLPFELSQ